MSKIILSREFENDIRNAMGVPDASPEFVSKLRYQLVSQAGGYQPSRRHPAWRLRLAWAVTLVVLAVLIVTTLAIGPQRVLAAVRGLFGYIPGVGLVQSDVDFHILAEPVTMEREGITLNVKQGAADDQRTIIVYQVDGLSLQAANSQEEGATTGSLEVLRLPDGSILEPISGGGGGWAVGFQMRLVYPPLPPGVDEVTLIIPILQSMPAGVAPENWEIQLQFVPAPDDLFLMPVYELPTPEPSPTAQTTLAADYPGTPGPTSEVLSNKFGIQLILEKVVDLENSYLFQGYFSWDGLDDVIGLRDDTFILTDANRNVIPIEAVPPDEISHLENEQTSSWAVQTNSKEYPGPWTLSVPSVIVGSGTQISLQIDLGLDPQLGQSWDINQELDIAGHLVHLTTIELYQDLDGSIWLESTFKGDPDVLGVHVSDPDNRSEMISGKGGGSGGNGEFTSAFTYDQIPTGVREMVLSNASYRMDGPWQVSWQPPVDHDQSFPTQTPQTQVCLTLDKWEQLKDQYPTELPDGLDGQLLLMMPSGQPLPMIFLTSLDGNQRQEIATGSWPSLSPDASILAFSRGDGIYLADISTGQTTHLSGTTEFDEYPIWSPDGKWIAFKRLTDQTIYRVHPDGTDLQSVFQSQDIVNISRWLPDEQRIVYEAFSQSGAAIRTVNIETGEVNKLIQSENIKPSSNYALTPHEDWIAFADQVFGQLAKGIYIARTDAADRRLLVDMDDITVLVGDWSADGEWLAITIYGPDPSLLPVLINLETCDVIPLWGLQGEVDSWISVNEP